ncbi:hypothetical protein VN24_12170 [Paenibacillus beijingensis]|uniref:NADP-dependent oxidoreductase domain-containing protein n=2 Tax=Paenibacillus beijingensis TaxID=1126833 RepID=A0A0D5NRB9_9BACL|nr:hypothetical protein VN24_12170 [Paenibacillus beijingensis]
MEGAAREQTEQIASRLSKRKVRLPDGTSLPCIGQGTWQMGDDPSARKEEIRALRFGVELGMKVIDTAEMYGDGRAETLVGEAIRGVRDEVFLVSKVLPHNAGGSRLARSCEQSLKRLGTDVVDLYLLHWRGSVPLSDTVEGMEKLVQAGKIRRWGVSNLDTDDMEELFKLAKGTHCATNQVLYHLGSRGIEFDLLPWMRERSMPVMAYCPLAQAGSLRRGMTDHPVVKEIAADHNASALQLLLAWCVRGGNVLAIPKASTTDHVLDNAKAGMIELSPEELARLNDIFPAPTEQVPLDIV